MVSSLSADVKRALNAFGIVNERVNLSRFLWKIPTKMKTMQFYTFFFILPR